MWVGKVCFYTLSMTIDNRYLLCVISARPPRCYRTVLVPYLGTNYRYRVVHHKQLAGFQQPDFDDSAFLCGSAAFGTIFRPCGLYTYANVRTLWPLNTDLLLRKKISLPSNVTEHHGLRLVHIAVFVCLCAFLHFCILTTTAFRWTTLFKADDWGCIWQPNSALVQWTWSEWRR